MKTLKEFLDSARQNMAQPQEEEFTPQSLSPIHLSTQVPGEADAYKAAFDEFLKYYGKDSRRADHFGNMLYDALVRRNPTLLNMWYHIHRN